METRIKALEVGATFEATQKDVKAVESDCLAKLQAIREVMVKGDNGGGAGGGASSKELQALQVENDVLKQKNAKLEYRVRHLVEALEDLYGKQQTNV